MASEQEKAQALEDLDAAELAVSQAAANRDQAKAHALSVVEPGNLCIKVAADGTLTPVMRPPGTDEFQAVPFTAFGPGAKK